MPSIMLAQFLLVSAALLLPVSAIAQRDPQAESTCYSRLNHENVRACIKEQAIQAGKDMESAEKLLAAAIRRELHANRTAALQQLSQANAHYRQYRKHQCEFQSEAASGKKSAPDRRMLCTTALDLQRTRDLKATVDALGSSSAKS